MGGWVGWLEKWGLKLISTQVVVEVEVGVELGNKNDNHNDNTAGPSEWLSHTALIPAVNLVYLQQSL